VTEEEPLFPKVPTGQVTEGYSGEHRDVKRWLPGDARINGWRTINGMDTRLAEDLTHLCVEVTKILRGTVSLDARPSPPPDVPTQIPIVDRPEWLTVEEAAAAASVSRSTI